MPTPKPDPRSGGDGAADAEKADKIARMKKLLGAADKRLEKAQAELQERDQRIQLLEARVHQMLGSWGSAQRAAARVVEATATYSGWKRGQPRMLAVALGTQAALEMGDGKKALGFLSSVLKYDPDQAEVRSQYKRLKEVLKLMESAEAQLVKGYNHRAVKELDGVLAKLRGMDVGNTLFRAQVRSRPFSRLPAPLSLIHISEPTRPY